MSWDILIMNFPEVDSISDIPKGYQPAPLGRRKDLINKLQTVLPNIGFVDPSWGQYEGDGYSIEFNMGKNEDCNSIMLHVWGNNKGAVTTIQKILKTLNFKAIDISSGDFFDTIKSLKSFKEWKQWRNQVLK